MKLRRFECLKIEGRKCNMPVNLKNYKGTKKLPIISIVVLSILVYIAIYTLNYYTPLYADDYSLCNWRK